ncbi:hypothetical protein GCM10025865_21830 [Paraoerskovia sediminicola]|uniref:ABC transporter transmembrane region n=1 Tax=Paraoerskovia sediminicola TaxID=1138587 RepID=A0ABM8G469_9CELL|nr:hypothetical protein [Paraoerskovia sediminicola]BDZ42884.1 hypothetical protein GCM10025865_21830 [Paraoerskovia sediminicola]
MFRDLWRAFVQLFTTGPGRAQVVALVALMASVPVAELLVIRMFSHLIVTGPETFRSDPGAVVRAAVVFFVAFGVARGVHHAVRVGRVQLFRRRFDDNAGPRSPSQESWDWALAFDLSGVLVNMVQVLAFAVVFVYLDVVTGLVGLAVTAAVMVGVSRMYARQRALQIEYVSMGSRPGAISVGQRVGRRVVTAETGSALASSGMVIVLVVVLWRAVQGEIVTADAIVFFLALRIAFGQLGALSGGMMRFARASARRGL